MEIIIVFFSPKCRAIFIYLYVLIIFFSFAAPKQFESSPEFTKVVYILISQNLIMDWAYIDPTDSSQLYSIGKKHIYVFKKIHFKHHYNHYPKIQLILLISWYHSISYGNMEFSTDEASFGF